MQPNYNIDLYPGSLAASLARDPDFHKFFQDPQNQAPDFEFEHR